MKEVKVSKIKSVEYVGESNRLYDLEVKNNHNFFAENVLVHNCHRAPSTAYISLINRLDCKFRIGLTATPDRKDGRWPLAEEALGGVVARIKTESMKPIVYLKKTNFSPPRQWRGRQAYNKSVEFLSNSKERNIDVIKQVFADLRKQKKSSIIIPVKRVAHAKKLTRLINKQAAYNNDHRDEKWPDKLAECLYGSSDKEKILDNARSYKTRVVVAIEKFVCDGIDVPSWTHMYLLFPGNNEVKYTQMTARILTPFDGKIQPVLRTWVDPIDIMKNCAKATYKGVFLPLNYKFGEKTKLQYEELVSERKVGKVWIKGDSNGRFEGPKNTTISVRSMTATGF